MYDVVVIGGNLAGTSAALAAASKGLNVALVERNKHPFQPAHCGEEIDIEILRFFDLYNLNYTKNHIKKFIINVGVKEYDFEFKKDVFLIVDRNFIENELLKRTKNIGVKLILGNRMKKFNKPHEIVLADDTSINGKIIIDSSGITCQVGKHIGIDTKLKPEDIGVGIQSRVQSNFNAGIVKIWFHEPFAPSGYAYLFPLTDKIANIGIGVKGGQKLDLNKLLHNYIKHEIKSDYKILSTFRSCVPVASPLKRLYRDNVMITGDAARLSNSLTGGGIRNAMVSGTIAGLVAVKYLNKEIQSLELYQSLLNKKIKSLTKIHRKKIKMENAKNFIKGYSRSFSVLCKLNKLAPNFSQNYVLKSYRKDGLMINSLK